MKYCTQGMTSWYVTSWSMMSWYVDTERAWWLHSLLGCGHVLIYTLKEMGT